MSTDLSNLSTSELENVIANAKKALAEKQRTERTAVIEQIHALASSIGVIVTIQQGRGETKANARKGSKVAIKYRNPNDASQAWTGRGVTPRWLTALLNAGHQIEAFLI